MKYNHVAATGDSTITGSQLNIADKNQRAYLGGNLFGKTHFRLDENGQNKKYPFSVDVNIITGDNISLISLNSQTMLEATGVTIEDNGNENYYIQATDDLGNGEGEIMFEPVLNLDSKDVIYYDKRDFATGISINSTTNILSEDALRVKVNAIYSNANTKHQYYENYDVFLNGQKIKYTEDPVEGITGVEIPAYGTTGNLFAIPKKDRVYEVYSDEPDVFGPRFVENHVDFYINGMECI